MVDAETLELERRIEEMYGPLNGSLPPTICWRTSPRLANFQSLPSLQRRKPKVPANPVFRGDDQIRTGGSGQSGINPDKLFALIGLAALPLIAGVLPELVALILLAVVVVLLAVAYVGLLLEDDPS